MSRAWKGEDEKLLPPAVIYGANASGKFLRWMVKDSRSLGGPETKIERNKFLLDSSGWSELTRIYVEFLSDNIRYEIGIEEFYDHGAAEWLH